MSEEPEDNDSKQHSSFDKLPIFKEKLDAFLALDTLEDVEWGIDQDSLEYRQFITLKVIVRCTCMHLTFGLTYVHPQVDGIPRATVFA